MKTILALAILFTISQAEYTTICQREGDEIVCTTEEDYFEKKERQDKEDEYRQEMEYQAEMQRIEAEIYHLNNE